MRIARRLGSGRWFVETIASFSVMTHFDGFQKGVLDSRDIVFFLSIIVFSLFTTSVDPSRSSRRLKKGLYMQKKSSKHFSIRRRAWSSWRSILVALNVITGAMNDRVDLTSEKAYTLSAGTRRSWQTRYSGEDSLLLHAKAKMQRPTRYS